MLCLEVSDSGGAFNEGIQRIVAGVKGEIPAGFFGGLAIGLRSGVFFGFAGGEEIELVFSGWNEGGHGLRAKYARVGGDERCGGRGGCGGGRRERVRVEARIGVGDGSARGQVLAEADFEMGHFFKK
jgi:hypothetical protein